MERLHSISIRLILAIAGMGISAIFDEGLLPEDRVVRLPIRGCNIRSNIEVACLKERRNSAPIRAFLSIAEELVN